MPPGPPAVGSNSEVHVSDHKICNVTVLHEGWGRLVKLTIRLPNGESMDREVEDHGAAVAVLPYDPERRMAILVRQFRAPVLLSSGMSRLLEAPAGMLEDEEPEACVRREAGEEAGLRLHALERVATVWSSPGISTERLHLFLAPYARHDRVSAGGGLQEEHEDIEVVELSLTEIWRMAEAGEILDLKTLALVQVLKLRRQDLFQDGPAG